MIKAQVYAGRRYNGEKINLLSRFILHSKLSNPISQTEFPLEVRLTRKVKKDSSEILEAFEQRWLLEIL